MILLLASLLTATTAAVPTSAAATTAADEATYVPFIKTTFDDYADEPPEDDVEEGTVTVDPNLQTARVHAQLDVWTPDLRVLVTALGTKDAAGACHPTVELVATNKSDALVVRRPGETTTPADSREPGGFDARVDGAPILAGKMLQCARFRLLDADGNVLDTAPPASFRSWPTANAKLWISGLDYRQLPINTWVQQRVSVTADPRGYDGRLTLHIPAGVEVRNVSRRTFHGTSRLTVTFELRVTTPGLHPFWFRASAGNAEPTSNVLYLWAPGGPHLPGTGSLTGRKVASFWNHCDSEGSNCRRQRNALWFLGGGLVYVGVPRHGAPRCTAAMVRPASDRGCQRYWWDKRRELLQVGRWLGRTDDDWISYRSFGYGENFGLARRGTRYHVLLECDEWQCGDRFLRTVRLTRTGRFVIRSGTWRHITTARGRYSIGARGRLTLRFRSGRVEVRTLGIGRYPATAPLEPHEQGILLSLPGGRPPVWLTPSF